MKDQTIARLRLHLFRRVSTVFIVSLSGIVLLFLVLNADKSTANSHFVEQVSETLTSTHFVYLPLVSSERSCTDPPSNTVMIAGQSTVYGIPTKRGVPFRLSYQHWESRPWPIITTTVQSDGNFCLGPVSALSDCRVGWYWVGFHYDEDSVLGDDYVSGWATQVCASEPGSVYTVSAEIGMVMNAPTNDATVTLPITFDWVRTVENESYILRWQQTHYCASIMWYGQETTVVITQTPSCIAYNQPITWYITGDSPQGIIFSKRQRIIIGQQ